MGIAVRKAPKRTRRERIGQFKLSRDETILKMINGRGL
jgi:hypothetical protein